MMEPGGAVPTTLMRRDRMTSPSAGKSIARPAWGAVVGCGLGWTLGSAVITLVGWGVSWTLGSAVS